MEKKDVDIAAHCLRLLLLPVMRFCLRRSLKLQEIIESCKSSLVEAAKHEMESLGERMTVNRMSVMTGLHRADVMRFLSGGEEKTAKSTSNIINRVIARWQVDERFLTTKGSPRVLTFDGKDGEFAELLRSVSSDPNPYTILLELERIQAVESTPHGVRLRTKEYIVASDVDASFRHLSKDSDDLIAAVEENVYRPRREPNLHLRTEYDNIGTQSLPEVRQWLLREGSAFHAKAREFLSRLDRDTNKSSTDTSPPVRVTITSFSRTDDGAAVVEPSENK
ncbi:MAG: DUF6502 family protein [Bdellovibrionota bacterium]